MSKPCRIAIGRTVAAVCMLLQASGIIADDDVVADDAPAAVPPGQPWKGSPITDRIAIAPNGGIVSASGFRRVSLWDARTARTLGEFDLIPISFNDASTVGAMLFTGDGESLVSAGRDGAMVWWSTKTKRAERVIREPWLFEEDRTSDTAPLEIRQYRPFVPLESLALSGDGKKVAAGTVDGTIHIWNAGSGEYLAEVGTRLSTRKVVPLKALFEDAGARRMLVQRVSMISLDELHALEERKEGPRFLKNITECQLWRLTGKESRVEFVALDQQGLTAAYACGSKLHVHDLRTEREVLTVDDCTAVVAVDRNTITCWQAGRERLTVIDLEEVSRQRVFTCSIDGQRIRKVVALPGLKNVLAECNDAGIRAVELATGRVVRVFSKPPGAGRLRNWCVSADANSLAVHWDDYGVRIWNIEF